MIPKTLEEAVQQLDAMLSDDDKEYLMENGAISVHHTLGRWIRNEWGLWEDSELKESLEKEGFSHPDDMSNHIIERFIEKINNEHHENTD
jgi:hypothetical protein